VGGHAEDKGSGPELTRALVSQQQGGVTQTLPPEEVQPLQPAQRRKAEVQKVHGVLRVVRERTRLKTDG
jgi:hypothetical protein